MDKLWLIIQREYLTKVRNRTFVVMTFVSPLIFIGVALLIGFLTNLNNDTVRKVAVLDQVSGYQELFIDSDQTEYIHIDNSLDQALLAARTADYHGLIHIYIGNDLKTSVTFYSDDSPNLSMIRSLEEIIEKKDTRENLSKNGLDVKAIEKAQVNIDIQLENYTGVKTSKMSGYIKMIFGGAAGYLLMMFIIIYGNMVMRSVIEEKTNRIIEVIISSVKPIQLMAGKILGTSLAGVTQFIIWVLLGGVFYTISVSYFGIDAVQSPAAQIGTDQLAQLGEFDLIINDVLQLPLATLIACFFIFFIGGYLLYASIYTAIGSAVDNETDTQQFMLPVIIPLVLAMYVGFFSVMDNPDGTVAQIFSYIPLTSPIVMLMRIPFGGVEWWHILTSVLILYSSIAIVSWMAAKIYRVGILMYGKKTNWKELYKWMKY
jgi:ABC-2 type transport system permease protein